MNHCHYCRSALDRIASYCPQCGAVQAAVGSDAVECEHHSGERAIGLCVVCGKPVCGDCAVSAEGKLFCENAQHQTVLREWGVVHESSFIFESDMIRQNLSSAGFETMIFSFREYPGSFWLPDALPARVMVPREKHAGAKKLLLSLHLIDQHEDERR